jgi:hypothetical protein
MPGFPSMPGMYAPANASVGVSPYQPQPSMSDATGNVGTSSGAPVTGASATPPAAAGGYDVADESRKFNAAFQPGSELERAWQNERDVQAQRPAAGDPRYKPSIWRTLGSIGAGFATGYAGHGSPQAVQEGMKITEGGMEEPYNKALSVWQPRMDAAKTDVEAAQRGYALDRQGVMDRATLDRERAQTKEAIDTGDYRARLETKMDQAAPAVRTLQGPDGQNHDYGWNPVTQKFDMDQGISAKQTPDKPDTETQEGQRFEDIETRRRMGQPVSKQEDAWSKSYRDRKTMGQAVMAGPRQEMADVQKAKLGETIYGPALDGSWRLGRMREDYRKALRGDQQAMVSLLSNHIGMTLGLQRGSRITLEHWKEAENSAPWLARVEARWSKEGYLEGTVLAPEQMKQMITLAESQYKYTWARARSQREQASQIGIDIPEPQDILGAGANAAPATQARPQTNAAPQNRQQKPKGKAKGGGGNPLGLTPPGSG